jgi:endonuclease/exonuclease/phosphatase family metal-dependent hydrolase
MVLFATVACIRENRPCVSLGDFNNAYDYITKRNKYDTGDIGDFEITTTEITQEEYEKEMRNKK